MIRFYLISVIVLLDSCNLKKKTSIDNLVGIYKYVEQPGDTIVYKNWGEKYWELEIHQDTSKLSYVETGRGINSFYLLTKVKSDGDSLYVKFDKVIFKAFLAPQEIDYLRHGDLLMNFKIKPNELITRSEFLTTTLESNSKKPSLFKFIKTQNKTD